MIVDKAFSKLKDVLKKTDKKDEPEVVVNENVKTDEQSKEVKKSFLNRSKKTLDKIRGVFVFIKEKIKGFDYSSKNLKTFSKPPKIYILIAVLAQIFFFYHSMIYMKNSIVDLIIKIKMGSFQVMVTVIPVKHQTIPISYKYVGNTDSMRNVDIRARVEGFLNEQKFVEGADVNEGDLLYVIDPSPFQAYLEQSEAKLSKSTAALDFAQKEYERYKPLVEKEYITKEQFDQYETNVEQALAVVKADQAEVDNAKLNLGYCYMYAPFAGRIGKTQVHIGNLVGAGGKDTVLATLVQLDPIYIYFSPSDKELHSILEAKNKSPLKVKVAFSDGAEFPHEGTLDFVNNVVDQTTSTVTMRAIMPNPEKTLLPGIYVTVNLMLGETPNALVVPEKALSEGQIGKTVFVVDEKNEVDQRIVETADSVNGFAIITNGIKEGELVIVDGIQRVHDGMKVAYRVEE